MCTGSGNYPHQATPSYHATWLGPSAPRIAATCGAGPLPILVAAVLDELTAAGRPFTAYDVTLVLRALLPYPLRELPHYDQHGVQGVQPEVHRQMAAYLTGGDYAARTLYRNGSDPVTLYMAAPSRRGRGSLGLFLRRVRAASAPALPKGAWVIDRPEP